MYSRTWACGEDGYETEWSYEDLAEKGNPVCPDGHDMELQPEVEG